MCIINVQLMMVIYVILLLVVTCCGTEICENNRTLGCNTFDIRNLYDQSLLFNSTLYGVLDTQCEGNRCFHIPDCASLNRHPYTQDSKVCGACFDFYSDGLEKSAGLGFCRYVGPKYGSSWMPRALTNSELGEALTGGGNDTKQYKDAVWQFVSFRYSKVDLVICERGGKDVHFFENVQTKFDIFPKFVLIKDHVVETLSDPLADPVDGELQVNFGNLFGTGTDAVTYNKRRNPPARVMQLNKAGNSYVEAPGALLDHVTKFDDEKHYQPTLVDLNGDGLQDIVFSPRKVDGNTYYVLNEGTVGNPVFGESNLLFNQASDCSFVDFDNNGVIDCFCTQQMKGTVTLRRPLYKYNRGNASHFDFFTVPKFGNPLDFSFGNNLDYGNLDAPIAFTNLDNLKGERIGVTCNKFGVVILWRSHLFSENVYFREVEAGTFLPIKKLPKKINISKKPPPSWWKTSST